MKKMLFKIFKKSKTFFFLVEFNVNIKLIDRQNCKTLAYSEVVLSGECSRSGEVALLFG